jgi:PAS domain S-box-containing protein
MYDLTSLRLSETLRLGAQLRATGDARTLEQAAQQTSRLLYDALGDETGRQSACVLVRCYKTHPFGELPPDLKVAARETIPGLVLSPETQCLTLVGTYGARPEWQSRRLSVGHRAIPLASDHVISSLPMVAALTRTLGLEADALVHPSAAILLEHDRRGFNVFHVAEAVDSPFIPAQESFVRPCGVRSVLGFGFVLPPTSIFAVIVFARVHIDDVTAQLFKALALNLKVAVLPWSSGPTFDGGEGGPGASDQLDMLLTRNATLQQLLEVHEEQAHTQFELIHRQHLALEERARQTAAASGKLATANAMLGDILKALPGALLVADHSGVVHVFNSAATTLLERSEGEIAGMQVAELFDGPGAFSLLDIESLGARGAVFQTETRVRTGRGEHTPVLVSATVFRDAASGGSLRVIYMAIDIRDRKKLEVELRQAQKLESVGRLAAGVAHEINTPVQFVGDSLSFIRDAMADLSRLILKYQELHAAAILPPTVAAAMTEAEEYADLAYLMEQVPLALERAVDGVNRVATIVRSLRAFAHPDETAMSLVDLNKGIEDTLVIASNEYKYVATIETDLGALPRVTCHGGDVNQVVLNIVVNAAHAIRDVVDRTETMGLIRIRTWTDEGFAAISIGDTGGGIPEAIREQIFDPFFTTKSVGHGTGQGLAIARSVICDKHRGELTFETEIGKGTTFTIRLPIAGAAGSGSE